MTITWRRPEIDAHTQRVLTGIVLIVPVLSILLFGSLWMWCFLVLMAGTAGLWELQRMVFPEGLSFGFRFLLMAGGCLMPLGAAFWGIAGLHAALFMSFFSGFFMLLLFSPQDPKGIPIIAFFTMSWLYIPYLLSYVLLLGGRADGNLWVFYILCVTVAGDVAAFYVGRRWGRRKLYENVSPKKTWEGALGGLAASLILAGSFAWLFLGEAFSVKLVLFTGFLAVLGQIGDLVESMIKRNSGIKDAGHILPGHGGVLDRIDSLLFVIPAVWCYVYWQTL